MDKQELKMSLLKEFGGMQTFSFIREAYKFLVEDDEDPRNSQYFADWDGSCGSFLYPEHILNSTSRKVQRFLAEKDKRLYREYWTDKHLADMARFIQFKIKGSESQESILRKLKNFVKSKSE